jgi:serine/threonine-protein kinase HipA
MELSVFFHSRPCGILGIDNERMSFSYLPDYVAAKGPQISVSMPIDQQTWPDAIAFPFFENLLPEGNIRQLLASRLGTADNNFSRLLRATGGDVAGAISIAADPHVHSQKQFEQQSHQPPLPPALSDKELGHVIELIKTQPFLPNNTEGMRLGLAGAQNKLPVVIDTNGGLHLPGVYTSSHIIKPPSERFAALVENEYLCMRAAARAGLNTPAVALRNFIAPDEQQHDCFIVKRCDRITHDGVTARLHQEDICQVTGTVSAQKYVVDGGPGFGELFSVIRQHTRPSALHQQELIRRMLFNLLIGNQDAHAKNFSLLHSSLSQPGKELVLSPAYDLVCTLVYEQLQDRLAMPVGHAKTIDELDSDALDEFQETTQVNLRRQASVLQRFVGKALSAVITQADATKKDTWQHSHAVLDQIVVIAKNHAQKLQQWLRS